MAWWNGGDWGSQPIGKLCCYAGTEIMNSINLRWWAFFRLLGNYTTDFQVSSSQGAPLPLILPYYEQTFSSSTEYWNQTITITSPVYISDSAVRLLLPNGSFSGSSIPFVLPFPYSSTTATLRLRGTKSGSVYRKTVRFYRLFPTYAHMDGIPTQSFTTFLNNAVNRLFRLIPYTGIDIDTPWNGTTPADNWYHFKTYTGLGDYPIPTRPHQTDSWRWVRDAVGYFRYFTDQVQWPFSVWPMCSQYAESDQAETYLKNTTYDPTWASITEIWSAEQSRFRFTYFPSELENKRVTIDPSYTFVKEGIGYRRFFRDNPSNQYVIEWTHDGDSLGSFVLPEDTGTGSSLSITDESILDGTQHTIYATIDGLYWKPELSAVLASISPEWVLSGQRGPLQMNLGQWPFCAAIGIPRQYTESRTSFVLGDMDGYDDFSPDSPAAPPYTRWRFAGHIPDSMITYG